jgi:hypothetical protein
VSALRRHDTFSGGAVEPDAPSRGFIVLGVYVLGDRCWLAVLAGWLHWRWLAGLHAVLAGWLAGCHAQLACAGWLAGCPAAVWLAGWLCLLACWLDAMFRWHVLAGSLAGWLPRCWLARWLAGWLAGLSG